MIDEKANKNADRSPYGTKECEMATGHVKRLVMDRGFGFIRNDANGEELFFHRSAVRIGSFESLREGQVVSFDVGNGPKGPRAESVQAQ